MNQGILKICFPFLQAFVVWANTELQNFVTRFSRQVFHRNIGLTAVGVCVGIASENCEKVNSNVVNSASLWVIPHHFRTISLYSSKSNNYNICFIFRYIVPIGAIF